MAVSAQSLYVTRPLWQSQPSLSIWPGHYGNLSPVSLSDRAIMAIPIHSLYLTGPLWQSQFSLFIWPGHYGNPNSVSLCDWAIRANSPQSLYVTRLLWRSQFSLSYDQAVMTIPVQSLYVTGPLSRVLMMHYWYLLSTQKAVVSQHSMRNAPGMTWKPHIHSETKGGCMGMNGG